LALGIRPELSRAQLDLGALLAAKGESVAAADLLRRAEHSADPDIRARAAQQLEKLGIH
jgi:hypothetical protein